MERDWAELVQLRGRLKASISRMWAYADKPPADCACEDVATRLERLQEVWSEFVVISTAMYKLREDPDYEDPDADFAVYEDRMLATRGRLRKLHNSLQPPTQPAQDESLAKLAGQQAEFFQQMSAASKEASAMRESDLPKIAIPPFTGQYMDWPSFKDLFVSAVHSKPNLTDTQKFHYLKSLLKGDAAQTLTHIPITDKAYDTAWVRLNDRYDRPRHIIASFIDTFMALPSLSAENSTVLRRISDGANEVIRGLDAIAHSERDCWLIYLLELKLDPESRRKWIETSRDNNAPSIIEFFDFLDSRCEELELAQHKSAFNCKTSVSSQGKSRHDTSRSLVSVDGSRATQRCAKCCATDHALAKCPAFEALHTDDRRSLAKDKSLCFNCLRSGHTSGTCNSKFRCRLCNRRHHTMLHPAQVVTSGSVSQASSSVVAGPASTPTLTANTSTAGMPWSTVAHVARPSFAFVSPQHHATVSTPLQERCKALLPTALVDVRTAQGYLIPCRVLLDSASELSYISERCAQKLGIQRSPSKIAVKGIASSKAETTRGCFSLTLKSRVSNHTLSALVHVLNSITSNLPTVTINIGSEKQLQRLELADPTFNLSTSVDILLGAQHIWDVFTGNKLADASGSYLAVSSIFGWIITSIAGWEEPSFTSSFVTVTDIDGSLRKFWEIEEPSCPQTTKSDDLFVEQHFQRTHSRHADGRYCVDLPFKDDNPRFANTLQGALSRFHAVERRLSRNQNLKSQYIDFMRQYEVLGHMKEIHHPHHAGNDGHVFYLPHHPVLGKKLRVVFDGSFEDASGVSLNSGLHVGPSIQRNLFAVCLRFRFHRFVFTADIVKMFRQIWVSEHHRDFQRILWRESPDQPLKHYQLCTVTYGTACAPFLSVRVLEQLAQDYQHQFPGASRVLREDFYVDDVLTGASSEEELINKRNELIQLLTSAGMELRKWISNSTAIMSDPSISHEIFAGELSKVLGLYWKPKEDTLAYNTRLEHTSIVTKRRVLSDAARVFDPLGLLAPIIIRFKTMFQELWLQNLAWDEPLPQTTANLWTQYRQDLHHVAALSLPRFVPSSMDGLEIHGFSDASIKAYAAAVYCRFKSKSGEFVVSLIAAKTRVAPLKTVSLPRLELCGALLLARLIKVVLEALPHQAVTVYAWCDSTVVLSWLSIPPVKLKTFVANRTSEVLDALPRSVWNHVASAENPADCASRGMPAADLLSFDLWWSGPPWLKNQDELNSILRKNSSFVPSTESEAAVEVKRTTINLLTTEDDLCHPITMLLDRVSSWQRVLRIMAYIFRFIHRCNKHIPDNLSASLSFDEVALARMTLLRHAQDCFKEERKSLQRNNEINPRSRLLKLTPFLDEHQLLRVGGRISNSALDLDGKHPIILPKQHRITQHNRHLHPGISALFVIVRQRYWILGARNLIRKITHNCLKCFRQRQTLTQQLMADLPRVRVLQAFPFQHAGCDYAGPISLKLYRGRNARQTKGYICIFVCLTTAAIHVELVTDLTTECFLAALKRFVSRRGKCTQIYSDNGRNFLGASRVLNEMQQALKSQQHNDIVAESLAMDGIRWNYIPPHSPHWGGIWESAVRSVKLHMRRVIGSSILTVEQMNTLLVQIEAVVNSRPLGVAPDTETNYLSPSHFLLGRPLTMVPEGSLQNISENKLDYWQQIQNMYQGFWRRWHQEYLTSLQNRPKWNRRTPNITAGDVVVIKDSNTPPAMWPMGKVLETYPGADGLTRVVKLRTARGELTRPITKLAVLPLF